MGELGEFLGFLIIISYVLAASQYILKLLNKKFGKKLRTYPKFYKVYLSVMKFVIRYHLYFGLFTIVAIIAHFLVQFSQFGLSITGLIAASLMLVQVILGLYGYLTKSKSKVWKTAHKVIAIIILIAIIIHI